jgi:protein O-GlcNAc transferase
MFWRFWASEEKDVDIFLSRDCDSRISEREVIAVNEWLNSDKDFHIMRDHPYHNVPILGGMWGCRNGLMKKIRLSNLINEWGKYERKGIDQDFLGEVVYPLIFNNAFEHSEFNLKFKGNIIPFSSIRKDYEFVGDVFDENEVRHQDFWKKIKEFSE